jgi:hypothetical protein
MEISKRQASQGGNVTIENDRPRKVVAVVSFYAARQDPMGTPIATATVPADMQATVQQAVPGTSGLGTVVTVDIYDTDDSGNQTSLLTTYGAYGISAPSIIGSVSVVVGVAGNNDVDDAVQWNSTVTLKDAAGVTLRQASQAFGYPSGPWQYLVRATAPSPGNYLVMQSSGTQNGAEIVQRITPSGSPVNPSQTWSLIRYWQGVRPANCSPVNCTLYCNNQPSGDTVSALAWVGSDLLAAQQVQPPSPDYPFFLIYYADVAAYQIVAYWTGKALTSADDADQTQLQYVTPDSPGARQYWIFLQNLS